MATMLMRLLAIAALFLMPFGMSGVASASAHHAPSTEGHCGEGTHQQQPDKLPPQVHCAAACVGIPGATSVPSAPVPAATQAPIRAPAFSIIGDQPETATPPPRLS